MHSLQDKCIDENGMIRCTECDNTPEWIFIYSNSPGAPIVVVAIYPIDTIIEDILMDHPSYGLGYVDFRRAKWNFGALPSHNETEPYKKY
jgi:hypothetical protein